MIMYDILYYYTTMLHEIVDLNHMYVDVSNKCSANQSLIAVRTQITISSVCMDIANPRRMLIEHTNRATLPIRGMLTNSDTNNISL